MEIKTKHNIGDWVEFDTTVIDVNKNRSVVKTKFKIQRVVVESFCEDGGVCNEILYLGRTDGDDDNYEFDAEMGEDEEERFVLVED